MTNRGVESTRQTLSACPACGDGLTVLAYGCPGCGTKIEGKFAGCPFCKMSDEERYFCLVFLQCEGSLKDVERVMGISYPTVKSRLAQLGRKLSGGVVAEQAETPTRKEPVAPERSDAVLGALERGEIDFPEAMARLAVGKSKEERR